LATLIVLFALLCIGWLEEWTGWTRFAMLYEVRGQDESAMYTAVLHVLDAAQIRLNVIERATIGTLQRMTFVVTCNKNRHQRLISELRASATTDQVVVFRDFEDE
jgi:putative Mg2+ transporter-C (MgtC) family protein